MRNPSRREFLSLQWRTSPGYDHGSGTPRHTPDLPDRNRALPGHARVTLYTERCLAWGGTDCVACFVACPLRGSALVLKDGQPHLQPIDTCTECRRCIEVCRTVNDVGAIRLISREPREASRSPRRYAPEDGGTT